jgi:membrane protein YqaA with SNARE-associated domain
MFDITTYLGLFSAAALAATLLPAQSELVLAGLLYAGKQPVWLLITVATVGNVLGSAINWWLGRYVEHFQDRRWFPIKPSALQKAAGWYHRYGRWSLLLSWAPVIGDPLTLAAGVLREPLYSFLGIVTVAKLLRYLVLAALTLNWVG